MTTLLVLLELSTQSPTENYIGWTTLIYLVCPSLHQNHFFTRIIQFAVEQLNSKYLLFSFSTDQLFVLSPQGEFKSRRQVIRLISAPLQIFYFRDNVLLQLIPFDPFAVFKEFFNTLPCVLQFTLEPLNCT